MNAPGRIIIKRVNTLQAGSIARLGFGEIHVTQKCGTIWCTKNEQQVFEMSCGCRIAHVEDAGPICPFCRADLEAIMEQIAPCQRPAPEELDWVATSCANCSHACSYPWCSVRGCHKHLSQAPDGQFYCQPHYLVMAQEVERQASLAQRGFVGHHVGGFLRSLFL